MFDQATPEQLKRFLVPKPGELLGSILGDSTTNAISGLLNNALRSLEAR